MSTPHSLEGIWCPIHAELSGETAPKMALEKMEFELCAGNYTVRFAGVAADHGTYSVDADGMTLLGVTGPNAGRTIPSIFKLTDSGLIICYGLDGTRPEKFATATGQQFYLVNYQRKNC